MAVTQTDLAGAEQHALREGCGVLDRSERGKLALRGADAVAFLNGQVTNELADLSPGQGRYAAFLTPKGKMLGDVRIVAVAATTSDSTSAIEGERASVELLLDTERAALQALFDMIRRYKVGYAVELHKRTLERGLLSLIGPAAIATCGAEVLDPSAEHSNAPLSLDGVDLLAVRTDVGVDLLCDAGDTARLSAMLVERGALAVSELAAEIVRVESGRPRFGLDMDDTTIPQEASLNERAVSFTKGCYVGQETVARLFYKGKPNRHLRGLRLSEPAETGEELLLGERAVGRVGSAVVSPTFGPIALALVRREAEPGTAVAVAGGRATGVVAELPFRVD